MAPGRISAPAAEIKIWIISVAPMPSMMRRPVAACQASEVAAARGSPADTQRRRDSSSCCVESASILRYIVGAVNRPVAPKSPYGEQQIFRRGLLDESGGRAEGERENQQGSQAKREAQRRAAQIDVIGRGRQQMAADHVRHREHVAVKMHGHLRRSGRAGSESQQADIVARGVDIREPLAVTRHQGFELTIAEADDFSEAVRRRGSVLQLRQQPRITQGVDRPRPARRPLPAPSHAA